MLALQLAANVDKLTCIEANPRNYDLLKLNMATQNSSNKVCCVNVAIAESIGQLNSSFTRRHRGWQNQTSAP